MPRARRKVSRVKTRRAITRALKTLKSANIGSTRELRKAVISDAELNATIKKLDRKVVPGPVGDWSCCFNRQ